MLLCTLCILAQNLEHAKFYLDISQNTIRVYKSSWPDGNKEDFVFLYIPLATLPVQQHVAKQNLCCVRNWTAQQTPSLGGAARVSLNLAKRKKFYFSRKCSCLFFSEHPIVIVHTLEQEKSSFLPEVLFSVLLCTTITVGFLTSSS